MITIITYIYYHTKVVKGCIHATSDHMYLDSRVLITLVPLMTVTLPNLSTPSVRTFSR